MIGRSYDFIISFISDLVAISKDVGFLENNENLITIFFFVFK